MLFVRHGQSEWNALGRWQGQADPPLSDLGRAQAKVAAGAIDAAATRAASPIAGIVSSTLVRALETATIISDALAVAPLHLEHGLVERDAGEWSGLTRHEIDERFPGYLANGTRPRGYEPDDVMLDRTLRAVDRVIERFAHVEDPDVPESTGVPLSVGVPLSAVGTGAPASDFDSACFPGGVSLLPG